MPPKVTDTRTNNADTLHAVEEETAQAARKIVATYADDFFDSVTLMCMLGVEPEKLNYRRLADEHKAAVVAADKRKKAAAKKTTAKKTAKKTTAKKTTAKKTTAKKTTAKKTTAKKTTAKKTTAKKTTAKKTTAKKTTAKKTTAKKTGK